MANTRGGMVTFPVCCLRTKMSFNCQVCNSKSSGIHFGASVCRACSAFFRRSVSRNEEYSCKKKGDCKIGTERRIMCKKCRFVKCQKIGMKKDSVQKHRDVYGKRLPVFRPISLPTPFLNRIGGMYKKLELDRIAVYQSYEPPRYVNYKQNIEILLREFYLISDWIYNSFIGYAALPTDQKDVLIRHFYFQFLNLESGFRSSQLRRNDVWFLPSGDLIDCVNLESFFHDPDEIQPISSEEAVRLFSPSFDSYHRNVSIPMITDHVDFMEFLALVTLILFPTGLEGQSDDCLEISRQIRETVQKEIIQYFKNTKNTEDAPIRMGNILSMLPNLERSSRRFTEDIELRRVLKAFPVDVDFYEKCLMKF